MAQFEHLGTGKGDLLPKTVPCKVRSVRRGTPTSVTVTLDPGPALPRFLHAPGQRITFCLQLAGGTCFRSYNLVNELGDLPRVAIKKVAEGGGSAMFNEVLQPGDVLNVVPPNGHLYDTQLDHAARHFLLFAAGSGITPIISVAKHALKARPDHRITLLYANSSAHDIMMRDELDVMAESERFDVFHILGDGATGEDLSTGRLDHAKLHRLLEQFRSVDLPEISFQSGPTGFMELVDDVAKRQSSPLRTTRYSFMQQPHLHPEDHRLDEATSDIILTINGQTREIKGASRRDTLLQTADEAGLAMPANCRSGICHRCKAKLISGHTVRSGPQSGRQVRKGWILCCQERPGSSSVEIEME